MEPLPGWFERRRRNLPPAEDVLARLPRGAAVKRAEEPAAAGTRRDPDSSGPGDPRVRRRDRARGARHPARAPRGRLRVGDLRRSRGPPARSDDARLSRAHRRQPSRQSAPASFLARVEGVAHGVCAPRPDGAHLSQHHAAGILRRPAPFAEQRMFPRAAGAARLRRTLRSRARRFRVQPPGSRGARVHEDRPCCRWCRISRISTGTPIARSPICSTTPGPTSCSSAVWCRTRRSKT